MAVTSSYQMTCGAAKKYKVVFCQLNRAEFFLRKGSHSASEEISGFL
jgi:hypothetical protein